MEERYYLVKMVVNTAGQDAPLIDAYLNRDDALTSYHNILAAYYNADDVLYAIVQIIDIHGNILFSEIVDKVPVPEPEPTPEPEKTIISINKEGNVYTVTYSDGSTDTYTESEPEES